MLHDIYSTREVEDTDGNKAEQEFILRSNVKTPVWIDENEIKLVIPQYSKKGRMFSKRLVVTTPTDSFILYHTFDELMKVVNKLNKKVGFKAHE